MLESGDGADPLERRGQALLGRVRMLDRSAHRHRVVKAEVRPRGGSPCGLLADELIEQDRIAAGDNPVEVGAAAPESDRAAWSPGFSRLAGMTGS